MCRSGARVRGWEYNGTIAWLMASVTCRMTDTGQRLALEAYAGIECGLSVRYLMH